MGSSSGVCKARQIVEIPINRMMKLVKYLWLEIMWHPIRKVFDGPNMNREFPCN